MGVKLSAADGERIIRLVAAQVFAVISYPQACRGMLPLCRARFRPWPHVTFDTFALLAYYAAGQGLLGLLLVHGFPRAVA